MVTTANDVDYGHDLSCVTDLDPNMIETTGRVLLAQALARRLITPRGGLIDDPNYGYDVRQFLNDDIDVAGRAAIASSIAGEFAKDERVLRSTTAVDYRRLDGVISVSSSITDRAGTFRLVLAVSDVTLSILKVAA